MLQLRTTQARHKQGHRSKNHSLPTWCVSGAACHTSSSRPSENILLGSVMNLYRCMQQPRVAVLGTVAQRNRSRRVYSLSTDGLNAIAVGLQDDFLGDQHTGVSRKGFRFRIFLTQDVFLFFFRVFTLSPLETYHSSRICANPGLHVPSLFLFLRHAMPLPPPPRF